ncbi:hypothetical protein EV356DRAFT_531987 [Viridothelium virens]|uniref:Uncharacterized protein n=1 Tax=Viridothelium virens TaxID=1048519 RepID=A0A6A6HB43_VIRVR|nr:hypothetical protein EV356DRAFT_531987 [Viridothelium virens]
MFGTHLFGSLHLVAMQWRQIHPSKQRDNEGDIVDQRCLVGVEARCLCKAVYRVWLYGARFHEVESAGGDFDEDANDAQVEYLRRYESCGLADMLDFHQILLHVLGSSICPSKEAVERRVRKRNHNDAQAQVEYLRLDKSYDLADMLDFYPHPHPDPTAHSRPWVSSSASPDTTIPAAYYCLLDHGVVMIVAPSTDGAWYGTQSNANKDQQEAFISTGNLMKLLDSLDPYDPNNMNIIILTTYGTFYGRALKEVTVTNDGKLRRTLYKSKKPAKKEEE